ncbi:MAG: cupredoxin domain-containing protein [Vicinamibacteraceae bacterium]
MRVATAGLRRPAVVLGLVAGVVAIVATAPGAGLVSAPQGTASTQDDRHREVAVTVTDAGFEPARIDARLNDIVAITLTAGDTPHGFSVDAYRVAKRVEPGKPLRFEFRADSVGTFPFYCSLTGADGRPHDERGELVVRR